MKYYDDLGKLGIGSRVRYLADVISQDAAEIYKVYGTNLQPKWFPVFHYLSQKGEGTVTAIAEEIGHSHASVSKIITEMSKAHLLSEKADATDRRRNLVTLSKRGKDVAEKIEPQYLDVTSAIEELTQQASHNLWEALKEWEYLLEKKSLLARVNQKRKERESAEVEIVPFKTKYQEAFQALNEEWIKKYFKIEEPDRVALENPKKYILDKGGFIFVALLNEEPVGVCALMVNKEDGTFELAKMAVSPKAQGKSIGYLLGKAILEKAKALGAESVFLESNTTLKPAIRLYEKLGFQKVSGKPSPYERANIRMEIELN
jgi:Predicted acetyltransferase